MKVLEIQTHSLHGVSHDFASMSSFTHSCPLPLSRCSRISTTYRLYTYVPLCSIVLCRLSNLLVDGAQQLSQARRTVRRHPRSGSVSTRANAFGSFSPEHGSISSLRNSQWNLMGTSSNTSRRMGARPLPTQNRAISSSRSLV